MMFIRPATLKRDYNKGHFLEGEPFLKNISFYLYNFFLSVIQTS